MSKEAIQTVIGNAIIDRHFAKVLVEGDQLTRQQLLQDYPDITPEEQAIIINAPQDGLRSFSDFVHKGLIRLYPYLADPPSLPPLRYPKP